jgi:hypothetical protein
VVAIAAQPFFLTASVNGKERNHVPDFLLLDGDGAVSVVNVKPADRLADAKVDEALGWAGAVFAGRGWRHEIWSGAPAVQLSNVRFLAAYRDPARLDPALVSAVADTPAGPVRLGEIERWWPQRVSVQLGCGGIHGLPSKSCMRASIAETPFFLVVER